MIPADELRHLDRGPRQGEAPGGAGLVDVVVTVADPGGLIERCRELLRAVLTGQAGDWPQAEVWAQILPQWFVEGCAPEQTQDETERWLAWWRGLDDAERARAAAQRPWSLADWLYWLHPDERQWYWWDATVSGPDRARITLAVPDWPAPVGALEWLLRVAGAETVSIDGGAAE